MAKYREMIVGKEAPPWIETSLIMAGGSNKAGYTLSIDNLRIQLTAGEVTSLIRTWNKIDNGEYCESQS